MGRFSNEIAVVTGGVRGIGEAAIRLFAEEGAKVVIADILDGSALAAEIGENAMYVRLDVTDEDSWISANEAIIEKFGPATILVNNAGVVGVGLITEMPREEFQRVVDINLYGTFLGMKTMAGAMAEAGRGAIVNVSSIDGTRGANGICAYVASKWAVRGITKTAAMELSPKGVRVNSIHPGATNTPLTNPNNLSGEEFDTLWAQDPLQRGGQPHEIAKCIAFLASDDAAFMTGAELVVDGGRSIGTYMSFLPGAPESVAPAAFGHKL